MNLKIFMSLTLREIGEGRGGEDVGQRHFRTSPIHAPVQHSTKLSKWYVGGMGSIPI